MILVQYSMSSSIQRSPAARKVTLSNTEGEISPMIEYEDGLLTALNLIMVAGRSYDPAAVQLITQNWIEEHMKQR